MTARLKYAPFAADYPRKAAAAANRRGEALLEPIKPQRNTVRKDKSHRHKERSEIKGQGRKAKDYVASHSVRTLDDKNCFRQEKGKGETYGWYAHKIEDEGKQLEKSDITSEHEPPATTDNSCYLSDVTQSTQKRKRLILRIKVRKPSEPDTLLAPSSSGRTEIVVAPNQPSAEPVVNQPSAEKNVGPGGLASKCDRELSCPIAEGIEMIGLKMKGSTQTADHISLIENWIPPPLQFAYSEDPDDDWLFQTNPQDGCGSKRYKDNNGVSCCTSSNGWPQARLLPEAGVYALPFTVPF